MATDKLVEKFSGLGHMQMNSVESLSAGGRRPSYSPPGFKLLMKLWQPFQITQLWRQCKQVNNILV